MMEAHSLPVRLMAARRLSRPSWWNAWVGVGGGGFGVMVSGGVLGVAKVAELC